MNIPRNSFRSSMAAMYVLIYVSIVFAMHDLYKLAFIL